MSSIPATSYATAISTATPSTYGWDTIPAYKLSQADVDDFLREKFGNYVFHTRVCILCRYLHPCPNICVQLCNDVYEFWIPRKLTDVSSLGISVATRCLVQA